MKRAIKERKMMDNSISIRQDLIIRSLPVNVELLKALKNKTQEVEYKFEELKTKN